MGRQITMATRNELVTKLRTRYRSAGRVEKVRILDEFVAVSGYHRKHATRLLGDPAYPAGDVRTGRQVRRIFDEAVIQALIVMWEAADRICGKRLKALLPSLVESMEGHGHLTLEESVRSRLLTMSAATIDRLLASTRRSANGRKPRRALSSTSVRRAVPIRTFADWNDPPPGFCEGDFVAHCGGSMAGSFLHTMTMTDIASGWTEGVALVARQQDLVVAALDVIRARLPIKLLGLDTDNDGAFINETVLAYCRKHGLEFTRSRPHRSNDQAWVEQKNGAVVRRLVGYARFEGIPAAKTLTRLLTVARLYVNFFQPSFKLREKVRTGARVTKRYDPPATPCDRLLANPIVDEETKKRLKQQRAALDPVRLLKEIREAQADLVAGAPTARSDLDEFLRALPDQWRGGDARPTHRKTPKPPRSWRTREDPLEELWPCIQTWLQASPDATARTLFDRLQREQPGCFAPGQLRTLQRRVKEWRHKMANRLIGLDDEFVAQAEMPSE